MTEVPPPPPHTSTTVSSNEILSDPTTNYLKQKTYGTDRLLPSLTPQSPPNQLFIWPDSNFTMPSCRDVELTTAKQRPLLIPNATRTKPTVSK
jgi:hypothetical protein